MVTEYTYPTAPGHTLTVERNRKWDAQYRGEWVGECSCGNEQVTVSYRSWSTLDLVGQWEVHLIQEGLNVGPYTKGGTP